MSSRTWIATALGALALAGAACSDHSAASPPATTAPAKPAVVTVQAMDDMFMGPATIAAGRTTIQLHNGGQAPHQLQLLRLHDGVSADQATTAAKSPNPGALLALVNPTGGPNAIAPTADGSVTLDLAPGTYLEVCFITDADGVPHLAKGMISVLTVTGEAKQLPPPPTVGTVTMHDFRFSLPSPFAGTGTLAVTNDGPQPHELTILSLGQHSVADAIAYLSTTAHSGPPPFTPAGGMGALSPGQTGFLDLHLPAGHYLAVCQVPDPKTGKPHVVLGMAASFTVS